MSEFIVTHSTEDLKTKARQQIDSLFISWSGQTPPPYVEQDWFAMFSLIEGNCLDLAKNLEEIKSILKEDDKALQGLFKLQSALQKQSEIYQKHAMSLNKIIPILSQIKGYIQRNEDRPVFFSKSLFGDEDEITG